MSVTGGSVERHGQGNAKARHPAVNGAADSPSSENIREHQAQQRRLMVAGIIPAERVSRTAEDMAISAREKAYGKLTYAAGAKKTTAEREQLRGLWLVACEKLRALQDRRDAQAQGPVA